MGSPLIGPENFFGLAAILFAVAAFAFWVDTTGWGRQISGVVFAILLATILSNVGVIPTSAPLYDDIIRHVIPFAIPLLLFKADFRRVARESGRMLIIFCIAASGTVLGVLVALLVMDFGVDTPSYAGMFAATYIGGSLNFYAVEATRPLSDPSMMAAAVAADAMVGMFYILAIVAAPGLPFLRRAIPSAIMDAADREDALARTAEKAAPPLNLLHIAAAISLSLGLCAVSMAAAEAVGAASYAILIVTALALLIANLFPKAMARLTGDAEIGTLAMYVFLAVIGASSDLRAMAASALPLMLFAAIIVSVHFVFVLAVGKLLKFDLAEIAVASNASVGGVATAAPFAAGRGWRDLVTPAVLCGTLGNAAATFIGVAITRLCASGAAFGFCAG